MSYTLNNISSMPINGEYLAKVLESLSASIYCKDKNGVYLETNNVFIESSAMTNAEIIGKKDDALIWHDQASSIMANDKEIILSNKPKTIVEIVKTYGKENNAYLSHKVPMHDRFGKVTGIFCCSLNLNKINNDHINIFNTALNTPESKNSSIMQKLSLKQKQVLNLLRKGYTAKQISSILSKSTRTIEHHIEAIKEKLGVTSKFAILNLFAEE